MSVNDWIGIVQGVATVASLAFFLGVIAWACGRRRRDAFTAAANAPFALPDEPLPKAQQPHGEVRA